MAINCKPIVTIKCIQSKEDGIDIVYAILHP